GKPDIGRIHDTAVRPDCTDRGRQLVEIERQACVYEEPRCLGREGERVRNGISVTFEFWCKLLQDIQRFKAGRIVDFVRIDVLRIESLREEIPYVVVLSNVDQHVMYEPVRMDR